MRILLATDLSSSAERAAALTRSLALPSGSALRVVSVLEPAPLVVRGLGPVDVGVTRAMVAEARARLRALVESLEAQGRAVELVVRVGRPGSEIVAEARAFAADVIVVGSRGRGPFATALLGSVAAEVSDHAPCPVLVARTEALGSLVLADDGSDGSRYAEELVRSWPFLARLPVRVVSVVDVPVPWYVDAGMAGGDAIAMRTYLEALERTRADERRNAAETATRLAAGGVDARAEIREGDAAGELVAAARAAGADLIVVGPRGLTGLARLLLGSVARNVLIHAPCSVLIARRAAAVEVREGADVAEGLAPAPA